jgi:hypothetical protein
MTKAALDTALAVAKIAKVTQSGAQGGQGAAKEAIVVKDDASFAAKFTANNPKLVAYGKSAVKLYKNKYTQTVMGVGKLMSAQLPFVLPICNVGTYMGGLCPA